MDPNATLREMLDLAAEFRGLQDQDDEIHSDDAARLGELFDALHDWITGGGFLPDLWRKQA